MKQLILLLLLLASATGMAQETASKDTTLLINGRKLVIKEHDGKVRIKLFERSSLGDTLANDQIFEGIYRDGQSTERRSSFSIPFTKKKKKEYNRNDFQPHVSGAYIGFSQLYDGFMNFNPDESTPIQASKSWEIAATLFGTALTLTPNKQWGLTTGLGWGYTSFRIDGNTAFQEKEGISGNYPAPEQIEYSKSRLRYFYFRIPMSLEWQKEINEKGPLFFSAGVEAEIRHGVKSKVKYNGETENIAKGLNIHPVGINLLLSGGCGEFGVYMRYSTYSLFEKNRGPKLYPLSFGLSWYFL